jgi:hypothetical protein
MLRGCAQARAVEAHSDDFSRGAAIWVFPEIAVSRRRGPRNGRADDHHRVLLTVQETGCGTLGRLIPGTGACTDPPREDLAAEGFGLGGRLDVQLFLQNIAAPLVLTEARWRLPRRRGA